MLPETTLQRLRLQLDCLPILLANAHVATLDRRPEPGKWSPRENLAHLARYQEVFRERLVRILREDAPEFQRYRAEEDHEWPLWSALPQHEVLARLTASRTEIVTMVEALAPADLQRTGIHPKFGRMTAVEWIEFFLLHEAHHLLAIMQRVRERD